MRIDEGDTGPQTAAMDTYTRWELLEQAEELAVSAFGDNASDEHVDAVYERLAFNWRMGLDSAGAVTVH